MFAESLEQFHWYAIQTRSRHEKVVRDQLAAKSITHLLPLWQKRSTWKDRVKLVDVPLFGGYLFGYFPLLNRVAVLETVGVVRIVGLNGRPVPIPDEQIATVRTLMEQRLPCSPHPYLVEGMRVRIKRGLLAMSIGDHMGNLIAPFWYMVIANVARVNFREFIGYGMIFAALWFTIGVLVFTFAPC
jgi:transcription antitermination factor NusG